jgi:hypothetical protein
VATRAYKYGKRWENSPYDILVTCWKEPMDWRFRAARLPMESLSPCWKLLTESLCYHISGGRPSEVCTAATKV